MLTQNDDHNNAELSLSPLMKAKHGQLGLMEIITDLPHMEIGKSMH